ncbi:MAG: hypothetical protein IKU86_01320 [Thermoguttaceae bacterium]|nr:hypothetical protein [Thermoguttaceae bacterium]
MKRERDKEKKRKEVANVLAETVEATVERVEERAGEKIGEAVGDFIGEATGEAIGAAVGETAGELIGAAAGPVGALAGGLVGLAAGKALDAAFRPEKSEAPAESEETERTEPASRRKIVGSVASLAVAEADALGFDVEKLRAALKFWKETSSATAALSDVGRRAASEAKAGCERLREAFAGEDGEENVGKGNGTDGERGRA